jgi:hypothetical protein
MQRIGRLVDATDAPTANVFFNQHLKMEVKFFIEFFFPVAFSHGSICLKNLRDGTG